jgi:DNA-binding NtrC family response regulator
MKPSVLIIDNDSHTREILQNTLLAEQYKVVCHRGKLDVVAHCVEMKPDVVLLNVSMPNMSELTILEGIKLSTPLVSVVVLTGNTTEDFVKNVISKGASGIIVKPFPIGRVLAVVKMCIKSI